MKELMIHVERIVRPVRAMQFRKLRMRRELLAHLRSAFDEERAAGADEAAAFEHAKRRLGNPPELTRSLQRSVPLIERLLFAKLPAPQPWQRLEARGWRIYGTEYPLTMGQESILIGSAAGFSYVALVLAVLVVRPHEFFSAALEHRATFALMNLVHIVIFVGAFAACARLIGGMLPAKRALRRARVAMLGGVVLVSPVVAMLAGIRWALHRTPTLWEMGRAFGIGAALLVIMLLTAWLIASLRRPYEQWLTLDVAD